MDLELQAKSKNIKSKEMLSCSSIEHKKAVSVFESALRRPSYSSRKEKHLFSSTGTVSPYAICTARPSFFQ